MKVTFVWTSTLYIEEIIIVVFTSVSIGCRVCFWVGHASCIKCITLDIFFCTSEYFERGCTMEIQKFINTCCFLMRDFSCCYPVVIVNARAQTLTVEVGTELLRIVGLIFMASFVQFHWERLDIRQQLFYSWYHLARMPFYTETTSKCITTVANGCAVLKPPKKRRQDYDVVASLGLRSHCSTKPRWWKSAHNRVPVMPKDPTPHQLSKNLQYVQKTPIPGQIKSEILRSDQEEVWRLNWRWPPATMRSITSFKALKSSALKEGKHYSQDDLQRHLRGEKVDLSKSKTEDDAEDEEEPDTRAVDDDGKLMFRPKKKPVEGHSSSVVVGSKAP